MQALAVKLKADATDATCVASGIDDGVVTGLVAGYYMLVETSHTSEDDYTIIPEAILVVVDGSEAGSSNSLTLKESKASITKKIVSEHDSELVDADTAAIGDVVTYELEAAIPTYSADASNLTFEIVDTLSAGLTYNKVSSVQFATSSASGYDVTGTDSSIAADSTVAGVYTVSQNGQVVTISLNDASIKTYVKVKVTLEATLNTSASTGTTGNPNSVHLTYSNDYYGKGSSDTTPEDTVITYTGELKIKKVNEQDEALENAKFVIKKEDSKQASALYFVETGTGQYRYAGTTSAGGGSTELVTDSNGEIKIVGLDSGIYYAEETDAPDGYSLATERFNVSLTVSSNNVTLTLDENGDGNAVTEAASAVDGAEANTSVSGSYTVTWKVNGNSTDNTKEITNKKGASLPGTGGIGTTLFTFGGLALVILAAAMFIVYTKKQRKQA